MVTPPQALQAMLHRELPPQRAFTYNRDAWVRHLCHLPDAAATVTALPSAVDRAIAARTVEDLIQASEIVPAFVVTMIWGHGSANYGPYRTARILSDAGNPGDDRAAGVAAGKLTESIRHARGGGPVEGYRYLNNDGRINWLGPAFFTKWLYLITARGDARSAQAAPVLDGLITKWMDTEANIHLRYRRTPDYQRYVETLHAWGEPHRLKPVDVEERIFRLIRRDGGS